VKASALTPLRGERRAEFQAIVYYTIAYGLCQKGDSNVIKLRTNLSEILVQRGIKPTDFVEMTGLSKKTLNNVYHDNWQYLGRKTIEKILEVLNIELTELFKVQKDVRPIRRVSPQVQNRFDFLAEKNTEGTLTPSEREEYEQLVDTLSKLMIENAERLSWVSDAR